MMKLPTYTTLVYAVCLGIGGVIGFIKGSEVSLWMGLAFMLILLLATYTLSKGKRVGLWTSFYTSALLLFFFAWRFALSGNWMPGGVMMLASALLLVISSIYLNLSKAKVSDETSE